MTVTPAPAESLADSLGLAQADADSAADAQILEELAAAHPEPQDTGNEGGSSEGLPGGANAATTSNVSYDIDVSTYGSHTRVQYYLDFFQGPARERFSIWLQRMPRYEPMIRAKLRENGVPEDMVYLALIESGFSNTAVSRARAAGMWQFIKGTAKLYGLRVDSWVDERRDPVRATDAAVRHIADLRDRFGSMYLAAAAYNAGAGKVGRGLRRLGDDEEEEEENPDATFFRLYDTRFLRRETKDYVPKLIAAALIAKQPEKYGFEKPLDVQPLTYDSIVVPEATGLDVLARLADTSVAALRELNPQYIHLVTPPRRPAVVRVPAGTGETVTARYAALAPSERVSFVEHTVRRGQTLGGIGRMYRVSGQLIADANPAVRVNRLRPGTRLVIPTRYVPVVAEPAERPARTRPVANASSSTTIRYRVRSGESLWTIAMSYGTTVERLRQLNALSRSERLKADQVIRVPAPAVEVTPPAAAPAPSPSTALAARSHRVRRGETLTSIASRYGVTITALRDANGLASTSMIKAGTQLTIPE
ncbi:MAG TPA: LysM peptidoglycan-binding domain-containing protein [Gemmatimonadales bacterium]